MNESKPLVRDGFQLSDDKFEMPKDVSALDPKTQRALTICNLFLNHKLTIADIIRVLDEEYGSVVLALLEQGVVRERRHRRLEPPEGVERRLKAAGSMDRS
ncbi:MAG: hypothetical protein AB1898_09265 [Acidobacteriota bacterium]